MNTPARRGLVAALGLAAAGGLALLGANLYVQSDAVQGRIAQRLSQALGTPVEITRVVLTPLGGLHADGIRAVTPDGREILRAGSFRASLGIGALLQGRVVVRRIVLEGPVLTLPQDAEGRWAWQKRPAAPSRGGEQSSPSEPAAPAGTLAVPESATASPPPSAGMELPEIRAPRAPAPSIVQFTEGLEEFRLEEAEIRLLDATGREAVVLEGVSFTARPLPRGTPGELTGQLRIARMTFDGGRWRFHDFLSTVRWGDGELALPDATAEIAGGRVEADFRARPADPGTPYRLKVRVADVSVSQLLADQGADASAADGRIEADAQLTGRASDPRSRQGGGTVKLRDARFRRSGLMKALGEVTRLEELRHPEFREAQAEFTVEGDRLRISPLLVRSVNLTLRAELAVQLPGGELDGDARLILAPPVARRLPAMLLGEFKDNPDGSGERWLDFKIGGTVAQPEYDLLRKILSEPVQSLLGRVFGRKAKKLAPEPPAPTPLSPMPSPAAPPSPSPVPSPS